MGDRKEALVMVPARMASTRLPGKPLADIHGEPMIVHVWRRASEAGIGPVFVATDDADIAAVLTEVGLGHLSSSLDRTARWEHELGDDEQRLLAFARLALKKPKWVIIDEALDAFDGPSLRRVLAMLERRLPETAIINIGRGQHNNQFFPRSLNIVKDSGAPALKPARVKAGAIEPPPPAARRKKVASEA